MDLVDSALTVAHVHLPSLNTTWRLYQLSAPFVTAAAMFTVIAVLATQWQGPWFGAVLAGVGSLGSVLSSALSRRAQTGCRRLGRSAHWLLSILWAASFASTTVVLVARGPVGLIVALSAVTGVFTGWISVFRRQAAATWGKQWIRLAGPTSRVGATLGAAAGSLAVIYEAWVVLGVLLLLPLSSPLGFAPLKPHAPSTATSRRHFARNAVFALLAVGPIAAMPSLVTATIGAQWVGLAMALYAVGAVASPMLIRAIPGMTPRGLAGFLATAALANASWLLIVLSPVGGLMLSRALSGVLLFSAEGSADVDAAADDSFGPAIAGRHLGVAAAGLSTGALLGVTDSVLATTSILAALSALGAITLRAASRRAQTSAESVLSPV